MMSFTEYDKLDKEAQKAFKKVLKKLNPKFPSWCPLKDGFISLIH